MSVNTIQYAFAAGEISPTYFGRTDLEKYDLGLEIARNWYVDYRGGLTTRPGTIFADFVQYDHKDTKFFDFRYAPDVANTYCMLFGDHYIRFLQEGAYVLEGAIAISSVTVDNPGVVTAVAHGFSPSDWVKIAGRTFEVGAVTTDTFHLLSTASVSFSTAGQTDILTATEVSRIYTIATPYEAEDLHGISCHQHLQTVRITSTSYAPYLLTRNDSIDWDFAAEIFASAVTTPANIAATSSDNDAQTATFAVTAVNDEGEESLPVYRAEGALCAFDDAGDVISIEWDGVPEAVKYNIYQSLLVPNANFTSGQQVGFLGQSKGPKFVNNNILPDFAATPPQGYNPFANGAIDSITITNPGTGYGNDVSVSIAGGGGSGFVGFPMYSAGEIQGVLIINRGQGYSSPVVSFAGSGGSAAAATAVATPLTGNNPALFCVFQQRGLYAATLNRPVTVWGSRIGNFADFSYSEVVVEDDSYEYTMDAKDVAPIRHLVASRGGLIIMSQSGIWLLSGGNETSVSAINALADLQTYNGVSAVPPVSIGPDILYIEGKGSSVKLLTFNDFSKVYGGTSMSILANHLFTPEKQIIAWSYAEAPANVVWAVRSDGALLAFTFVKEQSVYAWTQNWTRGLFLDVKAVQEGILDTTYVMVHRKIGSRWTKMIETLARRDIEYVEDAWCVDSGLSLPHTYPAATITAGSAFGYAVNVRSNVDIFTAGDVGKVLRAGGGKGTVVEFVTVRHVRVDWARAMTFIIQEHEDDSAPLPCVPGSWTLDTPVSVIGGLWHLEGEMVSILADGNVMSQRQVISGSITLDYPATQVIVGIAYRCIARNLPLTARDAVIEDKRKRVVGMGVRRHDTRGLKVGSSLEKLYEQKDIRVEMTGEPAALRRNVKYTAIEANFNEDGQTYLVQDYPLPATVLGVVQDFEVGDDND